MKFILDRYPEIGGLIIMGMVVYVIVKQSFSFQRLDEKLDEKIDAIKEQNGKPQKYYRYDYIDD